MHHRARRRRTDIDIDIYVYLDRHDIYVYCHRYNIRPALPSAGAREGAGPAWHVCMRI